MESYQKFFGEYEIKFDKPNCKKQHCELIPTPFMCLIAGRTNSGKTSLLTKVLINPHFLNHDSIILISNTCDQDKYRALKVCIDAGFSKENMTDLFSSLDSIEDILNFVKRERCPNGSITMECFTPLQDIPEPKDLDQSKTHVVIFDDFMSEKQEIANKYFCNGRHNNAHCFYVAQNFHKVDRQCIRTNTNFFILFEQNKKDIDHIFQDIASYDMGKDEFSKFCNTAWNRHRGYIVIDLSKDPSNMKYRIGMCNNYVPEKYR